MAGELQDRRVAFLVANEGIEQVELTRPWEAITQAGGRPELIALAQTSGFDVVAVHDAGAIAIVELTAH